jgi:hypothetical protein
MYKKKKKKVDYPKICTPHKETKTAASRSKGNDMKFRLKSILADQLLLRGT